MKRKKAYQLPNVIARPQLKDVRFIFVLVTYKSSRKAILYILFLNLMDINDKEK